jgi:hypothetical protein
VSEPSDGVPPVPGNDAPSIAQEVAGGAVESTSPAGEPPGDGRRLLAAVVALPWLLAYGVTGTWAVVRALRAMSDGASRLDAGYAHAVRPGGLLVVGVLLLVAFATLFALSLLLLWGGRSPRLWVPVAAVAWALTAGAVWAALAGGLSPGLWFLYFFGLGYAAVLATVVIAGLVRSSRRGRIVPP